MKKKILIFLPNFQFGGGEKISLDLAKEFKNNNIEVIFVVQEQKGEFSEEIMNFFQVKTLTKSYLTCFIKLLYILFFNRYDALISNYFPLNVISCFAGFITFTKVIAVEHSPPSLTPFINLNKYKFFTFLFYNLSHKIICVSNGVKLDILNNCYILKKKFLTIYNPIPDHGYRIKKNNNDIFKIITVGRLKHQKNHFLLIDAINLLDPKIKNNIHVEIIGDGELKNDLLEYIKKLKLFKNIKLIGFKKNPMEYVAQSNLFVLSSNYEGLPTVLIEALYTGIDIISTNCPYGPSEILPNYPNSTLTPINNAAAMSKSIENYFNNKNKIYFKKNTITNFLPETIFKKYYSVIYDD
jgi:glycosyltransferase involved in cell wall biosynthesis